MNITEFAKSRGVDPQAVQKYVARNKDLFDGKAVKDGKETRLLEAAIAILEKQYPLPQPVHVLQGIDPEEHRRVLAQLAAAETRNAQALDRIAQLLQEHGELKERLAYGEAVQLLLEDKSKRLDQTEEKLDQTTAQADKLKEELTAAKGEIERMKSRSLWQRIRNK